MQISPAVRFVFAVLFAAVVLGVALHRSGISPPVGLGIWAFVVGGFGTFLYFNLLRRGK